LSVPFGAEANVGKPELVDRNDGEPPSVCYVLPVAGAIKPSLAGFDGDVSAVVLVIRQDPLMPVDPTIVRDLLGLTLGEARVASLIGAGRSPRETANVLSITKETARTVLQRIFAKTGVSKQAHLATLLTRRCRRP
jgi:DNA-binding CsgD family transcriptional regulator